MAGITAFGAYLPKFRLTKQTQGWSAPGERTVANFDEDSVTMAVAAGRDCLAGVRRQSVGGLLFATTTPAYFEKQGASTIAAALDLPRDIFSEDIAGTLRGGTSALRAAVDAVNGGSAKTVIVAAADCRLAYPKSAMEQSLGDGAAALAIGDTNVAVEVEAASFITEHMMDVWRNTEQTYVTTGEDRFIAEEGYLTAMTDAIASLLKKTRLTPKDFTKAVYYSPDLRRHGDLARRLGFTANQVQDPLYGKVGNTGTAFPLMLLVAALETANPGDRILLAGYGDGADAYSLRVTEHIKKAKRGRRGIAKHLETGAPMADYEEFLRWRELLEREPARRPDPQPISIQASWRDRERNLNLHGARCKSCKRIHYPPQPICGFCQSSDGWDAVRLADKKGTIVTFSMDYLAGTTDVPMVIAVVNFAGGGRFLGMLTDREIDAIKVGMPVEMSFRKLGVIGGIHNYFWKTVPIRS